MKQEVLINGLVVLLQIGINHNDIWESIQPCKRAEENPDRESEEKESD